MATNYSANQYEKAYSPKYLQNWSPAKPTKERITSHEGYTQIIANDHGHLLPSVPRSQASPWGSFMNTWQMPLRLPPAKVNVTARSEAGIASLTKLIEKNPDLLKASNGLRPEFFGKPGPPCSREKLQEAVTKRVQQAPSPIIIPSSPTVNLNCENNSPHPSAGHTPGPSTPFNSFQGAAENLCDLEHKASPNLDEAQSCKPDVPEETNNPAEVQCLDSE